jgi:hypothetical protein
MVLIVLSFFLSCILCVCRRKHISKRLNGESEEGENASESEVNKTKERTNKRNRVRRILSSSPIELLSEASSLKAAMELSVNCITNQDLEEGQLSRKNAWTSCCNVLLHHSLWIFSSLISDSRFSGLHDLLVTSHKKFIVLSFQFETRINGPP